MYNLQVSHEIDGTGTSKLDDCTTLATLSWHRLLRQFTISGINSIKFLLPLLKSDKGCKTVHFCTEKLAYRANIIHVIPSRKSAPKFTQFGTDLPTEMLRISAVRNPHYFHSECTYRKAGHTRNEKGLNVSY